MTTTKYIQYLDSERFIGGDHYLRKLILEDNFLGMDRTDGGYIITLSPDAKQIFKINTAAKKAWNATNGKHEDEVSAVGLLLEAIIRILDDEYRERLYTMTEVAQILRLNRQTLYNNVRRGKLKATKCGKEYRITETQLQNIIKYGYSGKPEE